VFAGSAPEPGSGNADPENEIRRTVREKSGKDLEPEDGKELSAKRSISLSEGKTTEKKQALQKVSDPKTGGMSEIVPGQIIVKYKSGTSIKMKSALSSKVSAVSSKTIGKLGLSQIELPRGVNINDAMDKLKDDPNVDYVEPVYVRRAFGMDELESSSVVESVYCSEPFYTRGWQWGLEAINLEDMWKAAPEEDREDITIAIVDSGVDMDYDEFTDSFVEGYDFINNDSDADDDCGHGTHVAGIAAAAHNGKGMAGVAGGAKIMPVKVLDEYGEGSTVTVINGILYAVNNGADIINLSLGSRDSSRAEEEAVQYALNKGCGSE
jgi:subtilisin family serine protease